MSEKERDNVGLEPFAAALADSISEQNPDLEDAVEGELDALLFDDDPEEPGENVLQLLADGVIGVDPY